MSELDTSQTLSFKRVEISLTKFNDVAVPYHLDLLKKHITNIQKHAQLHDWQRIKNEKVNASRVVKQLKQLLYEIDLLRSQVNEHEIDKFDRFTTSSRQKTQEAIEEYLALIPIIKYSTPLTPNNFGESTNGGEVIGFGTEQIQLSVDVNGAVKELKQHAETFKTYEDLQNEVTDLHELFMEFESAVKQQKEQVDQVETNFLEARENVAVSERTLSKIGKIGGGLYPVAGALLGGCIGGPIGLLAGVKLGGLVAMSFGIIGFTGGRILHKRQKVQDEIKDKEK